MTTEEFKSKLTRINWDRITAIHNQSTGNIEINEENTWFIVPVFSTWNRDLMEFCKGYKILWMNRDRYGFNPITETDIFWHDLQKLNCSRGAILTTLFNNHTITILNGQNDPFKIKGVDGWEQHFKNFCEDKNLIWKNIKDWIPVQFEGPFVPNQILYDGDKPELSAEDLNQMMDIHFDGPLYAETFTNGIDLKVRRVAPLEEALEHEMNHYVLGFLYGWDGGQDVTI